MDQETDIYINIICIKKINEKVWKKLNKEFQDKYEKNRNNLW